MPKHKKSPPPPVRVQLMPTGPDRPVDPKTKQLVGDDGVQVELDSYWRRRLADGSMRIVPANAPASRKNDRPAPAPADKKDKD